MRSAVLFLLLLSFHPLLSQSMHSLEGRVTDQKTGEPLPYVNVYVSGTNYGTITNQSGHFTLKYPVTITDGTITFSHLGYKPQQPSMQSIQDEFVAIAMDVQPVELSEVVVRPLNPLDIVYHAISKIPENYNQNFHSTSGFQREYVSHSDEIIQLLETTFKTINPGSQQLPVSTVLDARYIEDKQEKAPLWNPSRGGFYTFGWTTVSGIVPPDKREFLGITVNKKSDLNKYYEFSLQETVPAEHGEVYVIDFDQKKSIRQALLKGTLYIDVASGAIVKLVHELSPLGVKHLKPHETYGGQVISKPPKKLEIIKDRSAITYRRHGSKWYLHTIVQDAVFDASLVFFRVVTSQTLTLKFHSERMVTNIDTTQNQVANTTSNITEVGQIPTLQNFIKKNFENYDQNEINKWSDENIIRSDTSFATVAKQLHANNQAWEKATGLATAAAAVSVHHQSNQLNEDLDFLKTSLEGIHPGLYWYTDKTELDQAFTRVREKSKSGGTESDFYRLLGPLIEQIHCGHTNLMPSVNKTFLLDSAPRFPLELSIHGDSVTVSRAMNGIEAGSRITSINGNQMPDVIEQIKSSIPSDGYNTTYKTFRIQHEFDKLFRSHFNAGDSFNITIQDTSGRRRAVVLPGTYLKPQDTSHFFNLRIIDTLQTALLIIPAFTEDGFAEFIGNVFEQLNRDSILNLIIDIRNNEGGRDELGLTLYSYLAHKPFEYYRRITVRTADTTLLSRLSFGSIPFNQALPDYSGQITNLSFNSHSNLGEHEPKANAFKGKVYILINGGTFSTAAEFASIAHANDRAVFIGTETGGGYYGNCSLGTPTITLPNSKLRLTIPLGKYELAVANTAPPGRGLTPDHPITEDATDPDRDMALEYCLELIKKIKQ